MLVLSISKLCLKSRCDQNTLPLAEIRFHTKLLYYALNGGL